MTNKCDQEHHTVSMKTKQNIFILWNENKNKKENKKGQKKLNSGKIKSITSITEI